MDDPQERHDDGHVPDAVPLMIATDNIGDYGYKDCVIYDGPEITVTS